MSICVEQCNYSNNSSNNHRSKQNKSSHCLATTDKPLNLLGTGLLKKRFFAHFKVWFDRYRQRKQLAQLDERMLKDIGCTPSQARAEYKNPFWK